VNTFGDFPGRASSNRPNLGSTGSCFSKKPNAGQWPVLFWITSIIAELVLVIPRQRHRGGMLVQPPGPEFFFRAPNAGGALNCRLKDESPALQRPEKTSPTKRRKLSTALRQKCGAFRHLPATHRWTCAGLLFHVSRRIRRSERTIETPLPPPRVA